ncbi:tetratricopeptide repeat protein [Micromonospora sp. NPDC050686]|uniref:ATP-binding protein n=1 Tax=Micromonospora sp. NPDC050686 TaxID=3154631 RepID=UPI0033D886C2
MLEKLDEIVGIDQRGRTVVITGAAGVGKTALAVYWAHRAAARYLDGQLYVNLNGYAEAPPRESIDVLSMFLRTLGVRPEHVPESVAEASSLYRTLLAARRMLVILDNAHSPQQVRPLLPAGPGCVALVTSRSCLSGIVATDGAERITLDALEPSAAYELLVGKLGPRRARGQETDIKQLASACGYLPLALCIAAANLDSRSQQPIGDYLAALRGVNRLSALAVFDDSEAAVRTAFQLSYDAASGGGRRLFRLLSLVPGPDFGIGAAGVVMGADEPSVSVLMSELADAHLISESRAGRFTFHDLLREYARERADVEEKDNEKERARQRLFRWYLVNVDSAASALYPQMVRLPAPLSNRESNRWTATPSLAAAWLEAEYRNLVACVHEAGTNGSEVAWLIADGLRGFHWRQGMFADWRSITSAALAAAERSHNSIAQAAMRLSLGHAAHYKCNYRDAASHLAEAVSLSERAGWRLGTIAAKTNLGTVYAQMGELSLALAEHTGALELASDPAQRGTLLNNLGNDYRFLGRLDEALDVLSRARLIYKQAGGSAIGEAAVLDSLGAVHHELGKFEEARGLLLEALEICEVIGHAQVEATTRIDLALLCSDAGDLAAALRHGTAAARMVNKVGGRGMQAELANCLGVIHLTLGNFDRSLTNYKAAIALAEKVGAPHVQSRAYLGLCRVYLVLGDVRGARRAASSALGIARKHMFAEVERLARAILVEAASGPM